MIATARARLGWRRLSRGLCRSPVLTPLLLAYVCPLLGESQQEVKVLWIWWKALLQPAHVIYLVLCRVLLYIAICPSERLKFSRRNLQVSSWEPPAWNSTYPPVTLYPLDKQAWSKFACPGLLNSGEYFSHEKGSQGYCLHKTWCLEVGDVEPNHRTMNKQQHASAKLHSSWDHWIRD